MTPLSDAALRAVIEARADTGPYAGVCPICGAKLHATVRPKSRFADAVICIDCNTEEIIGAKLPPLTKWRIITRPDGEPARLF